MTKNIFPFVIMALLILCGFVNNASAQMGIALKYGLHYENYPGDVPGLPNKTEKMNAGIVALDYRLKLVNYGVAFGPEIYGKFIKPKELLLTSPEDPEGKYFESIRSIGLAIPVTIYPFHFDQCDECPSFRSKNQLTHTFFIQPVFGYEYRDWQIDAPTFPDPINEHMVVAGFGLGVDILLTKYLRLSPMAQYRHFFGMTERAYYDRKASAGSLELGMRLGWGR